MEPGVDGWDEVDMKLMIERARHNGLWFWSRYQDLWFSPNELERHQMNGRFRWGPLSWQLRDPQEHITELQNLCEHANEALKKFIVRFVAAGEAIMSEDFMAFQKPETNNGNEQMTEVIDLLAEILSELQRIRYYLENKEALR